MSNLIKGYQAADTKPFIIDADKRDVVRKLNEEVKKRQKQKAIDDMVSSKTDEQGFAAGIEASVLTKEEARMYADYEPNVEDAHEAAIVVNEAYKEAEEILSNAHAQIEDLKAQSELVGREEGRQAGYQEGIALAQDEIEQLKQNLLEEQETLKKQLLAEQEASLQMLEPRFAKILCDLLQKLTGVVTEGYNGVIMYLIDNAIREIENSHSFIIYLSEADYTHVEQQKEEIYGYLNPSVKIELFQDASLSKNQCKIETDGGLVDLSLDVQLSQMVKALELLNA